MRIALGGLCFWLFAAMCSAAGPFDGTWTAHVVRPAPAGPQDLTIRLATDEGKVTGSIAIQGGGQSPIEWGIKEFGQGIAISTSFQADSVALIDMAYELDPEINVFSVDTGRLPAETFELADRLRDRYPGLNLELVEPSPDEIASMTGKHGVDLFKTSVDLRLLCCNLRKFGSAMEDGGEAYSCRDARPCVQQSSFPLPSSSAGDPRPRFWPLRVVRGRVPWSHTQGAF